ncbi:bifunctional isocitrate dehydrogenase kinase/phosphatase [Lentisalinibacter sediminis]|uniref:bifunctional isocitrate dehydrogenase kinase/phosphatase n=1 Tax=Lentisalinibacter sediminis TaxID=2992237 RepID=UPI00386D0025
MSADEDDNASTMAAETAEFIVEAFLHYNREFRLITQRARGRFERREWAAGQQDAGERIDLYDKIVNGTVAELKVRLDDRAQDRELWAAIKEHYARMILEYPDSEFFKTFFSSITRRIFATIGVDPAVEFIALDVEPTEHLLDGIQRRVYKNRGALDFVFDEMLSDYSFSVPFRDRERTINYITLEVDAFRESHGPDARIRRIELLEPVFYQGTRAYLVGRIQGNDWWSPLVIALKNTDEGIYADAVILSENDVSMLFGFTRSYFHVDLEVVGATVAMLKSMLPRKPIAEIYTVLGRAKQGKTERYRSFFHHLEQSDDLFVRARGDKGMVMEVFTLPSYDIVFKVIKDRFAFPKTTVRKDVLEKYQLVFKHDRAGRLVDAQEFRRLEFGKHRFEESLLEDLLTGCADTCRIEGEDLIVEHAYIERRLTPLNLYVQEADYDDALRAVIDYGQAIRDLAFSNIFAGDLLLKNFGVTRHGRVIFYDYDELCLVTEANFRNMPTPRDDMEEMQSGAWFYVGPNDVFPEQFIEFLGLKPDYREAFMEHHSELLQAEWWIGVQKRLKAGEIIEVVPYSPRSWADHRGPGLYALRH